MNSRKSKTMARGIRNNNPLNIKHGDRWMGLAERQTDEVFCQFREMAYGCRAAFIILRRYINRYGLNTVEKIVHRWCPDHTAESYVRTVCRRMGIGRNDPIRFENEQQMVALFQAMAWVECGCTVDEQAVSRGYEDVILFRRDSRRRSAGC